MSRAGKVLAWLPLGTALVGLVARLVGRGDSSLQPSPAAQRGAQADAADARLLAARGRRR